MSGPLSKEQIFEMEFARVTRDDDYLAAAEFGLREVARYTRENNYRMVQIIMDRMMPTLD